MKCGLCLKIWNRSFVCVIQLLNTEYCDLVLKPILEISNMLVFKYCKINQSTKQYKSTKVQNIYLHGACSGLVNRGRSHSLPWHYVTMSLCHYAALEGITVTVLLTHQPNTQPSLKIYGVKGSRISFHYIILFVYRSSGRSAPFLLAPAEGWGALWALLGAFGPLFSSRRSK